MSYKDAIDYLELHTNLGVKPGLERIEWLVDAMGRPDRCAPAIQVTGTNGKTTVARTVAQILQECGFRTGTYTSPHLERINERIALDCEPISDDAFSGAFEDVLPFAELMKNKIGESATYFELVTAMAFAAFADAPVSVQILEVGMGGAWDATNVAEAQVAAFTSVSLDHTDYLGDTVEAIAAEKAGIISPGSTVVIGYMPQGSVAAIESRATARGAASVLKAGTDFEIVDRAVAHGGQVISLQTPLSHYSDLYLPLYGEHQALNASVAVAVAEAAVGGELESELLCLALEKVQSPGRIEVVGHSPLVVLDGAHNPSGAASLMSAIRESFLFDRLVLVIGILEGKDVDGIASALAPEADIAIATQAAEGHVVPADVIAQAIAAHGNGLVEVCEDLSRAVELAFEVASADDLILVAGSLYLVGEARSQLVSG
ncbi:MAG: dihydrofolate synthase [Acidobacteria bacterium]|nr:MAG: dihydrofolate synthase [Acidobacteriota bacterium]